MDNEHRTDEDIVESVLYGDIESYEELLDRYQNKIFSIGMRFFKNRDDAHDFAQDVFIKAFESLSTYRGGAPFRFWLTKIAYNHGINSKSKMKIEPMISGDHSLFNPVFRWLGRLLYAGGIIGFARDLGELQQQLVDQGIAVWSGEPFRQATQTLPDELAQVSDRIRALLHMPGS